MKKLRKVVLSVAFAGALTFGAFSFSATEASAGCYGSYADGNGEIVACQ